MFSAEIAHGQFQQLKKPSVKTSVTNTLFYEEKSISI